MHAGQIGCAYVCHLQRSAYLCMHASAAQPWLGRAWATHPYGAIYIQPSPQKGYFTPVNHNTVFTIPYAQYSPHTAYTVPTAR